MPRVLLGWGIGIAVARILVIYHYYVTGIKLIPEALLVFGFIVQTILIAIGGGLIGAQRMKRKQKVNLSRI